MESFYPILLFDLFTYCIKHLSKSTNQYPGITVYGHSILT